MRHLRQNKKFGRSKSHREALIPMLVTGLIKAESITTTLQKAKVARQLAEKLVTKAKTKSIPARRLIAASLRDEAAAKKLMEVTAPTFGDRPGGFTRITKIGPRRGDGAEMAILAWVTEKYEPKAKTETAPETEPAS